MLGRLADENTALSSLDAAGNWCIPLSTNMNAAVTNSRILLRRKTPSADTFFNCILLNDLLQDKSRLGNMMWNKCLQIPILKAKKQIIQLNSISTQITERKTIHKFLKNQKWWSIPQYNRHFHSSQHNNNRVQYHEKYDALGNLCRCCQINFLLSEIQDSPGVSPPWPSPTSSCFHT